MSLDTKKIGRCVWATPHTDFFVVRERLWMAAALAKIFGTGKKGEPPSPQQAIQKLRETEEMLSKKTEFLEKKIDKEMQTVKKNGMKNKRGNPRRWMLCTGVIRNTVAKEMILNTTTFFVCFMGF